MKRAPVYILICLLCFTDIQAGDFFISHAGPELDNGHLRVELGLENVFSEQIEGTILSGLPALVDVYIQLRNEKSGKKIKKAVTIRIRHDVWKGRFYADLQDSSYVFEHFDRLKQFFHSLYFDISPAGALDRNAPFVLTTWAEVAAISKVQNDRLKDWIMNADETEEMHASDKRNPGFRFSISRLIGSMVGSKKNPDNMTPRYQTDQFTINGLR